MLNGGPSSSLPTCCFQLETSPGYNKLSTTVLSTKYSVLQHLLPIVKLQRDYTEVGCILALDFSAPVQQLWQTSGPG